MKKSNHSLDDRAEKGFEFYNCCKNRSLQERLRRMIKIKGILSFRDFANVAVAFYSYESMGLLVASVSE